MLKQSGGGRSPVFHTYGRLRPLANGFRTGLVNFRIASIIRSADEPETTLFVGHLRVYPYKSVRHLDLCRDRLATRV
jgi:hypothetical protein